MAQNSEAKPKVILAFRNTQAAAETYIQQLKALAELSGMDDFGIDSLAEEIRDDLFDVATELGIVDDIYDVSNL